MFAPFIPPAAQQLQDADAIALLRRLKRYSITVPKLAATEAATILPTAALTPESPAQPPDSSPLLLLHGFDSSLLEFRRLIPHLAPHRPVFALDWLGFGFTAHLPSVPVAPRTIAQHLYYAWKTLIDRPVTLVGASLGGAVALDFALTHPACVERLVLIDSVGFSGNFPVARLITSSLLELGADWLHYRKEVASQVLNWLPFVDPRQRDLVLCSSLHQAVPGWKQAVVSFSRSGGYTHLPQRLGEVRQPTLIVWGERDASLGTEDARKFEQAIPQSRLAWIKSAGHVPHLFSPAAVAQEILRPT